jgi:predicted porin
MMKKSLIALAVLASVAGVAQAQSSVSVYGVVDAVLHKDKGASAALTSGGVSGSRLGFKGTEDLGGGLKANFLLEHGFNVDTGTQRTAGSSFDRQAYVGLSGGFGELKLGKIWTAYDDIAGATNPVFDSVLAPTNVWASAGYNGNPSNGIYFASPTMGGVSGAFSTNLKEGSNNQSNAFHVKYEGGPVFVGAAYQVDKVTGGDTKFTRLNGSYDLGAAKLLAGYGNVKAGSAKTTDFAFGADVPLGANLTLSAGYASSKKDGASVTAKGLGLGVAYSLSKRTTVYGGFLDTKNATPDTRYGVGIKHTF